MRDARQSVDRAVRLGRKLGYKVRQADFRDIDGTVMVEYDWYGELVELYFKEHPRTGYLRFHMGFRHGGTSGDRYYRWHAIEDLVRSLAGYGRERGISPHLEDA